MRITNAQRKAYAPKHNDPDLQAVKDVLGYYVGYHGSAAGYSRACMEDLAILIKMAREAKSVGS